MNIQDRVRRREEKRRASSMNTDNNISNMMIDPAQLINIIDVPLEGQITKSECDNLLGMIPTNNVDDSIITNLNWVVSQFFIHCTIDTEVLPNKTVKNRYTGLMDGTGVYPEEMTAHPLMNGKGYFVLNEGNLQSIISDAGTKALGADIHRVSENRFLSAITLMFYMIHNNRMGVHGDVWRAREETMGLASLMCMHHALDVIEQESFRDIFGKVMFPGATNTMECAFGFGRYGHFQVPERVWDRKIFSEFHHEDVTDILNELMDLGPAQAIGEGISQGMNEMHHIHAGPNISKLNMDRHTELLIAPWDEIVVAVATLTDDPLQKERVMDINANVPIGCPIFLGMHLEAKEAKTGIWGPVASQLIGDMYAHSCSYGNGQGLGLWHPLWDGAPTNSLEMLNYAVHGQT